jgi:hypothetical protein
MACLRRAETRAERFFTEKTVKLKGYERPIVVWATSFPDLRSFVSGLPEDETTAFTA